MTRVLLLLLVLLSFEANSQMNFGEFNTPYSGVDGMKYNPAEIVDSRYGFQLSLLNFGVEASNNYISISNELLSMSPPNVTDSNKHLYIKENLNGRAKSLYAISDFSLLNCMVSFKKSSIGLQLGVKTIGTANNVSELLARYAYDNNNEDAWGPSVSEDMNVNGTVWSYIGLTYGRELINKNRNYLKFGITGKVNIGILSTYAESDNLYTEFTGSNELNKANGSVHQQFSLSLAPDGKFEEPSFDFGNMGFGTDIGLIYEKRDNEDYTYEFDCKEDNIRHDKNKYRFRVGLSLTDFGYMTFKPLVPLNYIHVDSAGMHTPINTKTLEEILDGDKYLDSLQDLQFNGFALDTNKASFQVWTPSNINVFADFHVWKGFYAAVNARYGFVLPNDGGSFMQNSQFNFVPRFETKALGVYLPVNYNMLAEEVNVGLGLRLFALNIAVRDWTSLAGLKGETKNFGFNMSLNIPFHKKKHPKDKDHDLISDKMDECDDEPGDCNTGGCADPDDDGDGVTNTQDKCPTKKGLPEFHGCPDSDKDGVEDKIDRCPRVKGLKELGGCPDSDKDGIADKDDKCPKEAGPKEAGGCPDTDGDKIPNNLDDCPFEPGIVENNGCPEDKTKDTDKDGVPDLDDSCPEEFGPKSNNGCPISEEGRTLLSMAIENLEFNTASSEIRKESYTSLQLLAQYLNLNKSYKLSISGHTDDEGEADKNLKLSQARANSVRNYFISRGVDESRLKAQGYGESMPIADNNTESGRAVNRRVELEIE